jgi:hypothetical protein
MLHDLMKKVFSRPGAKKVAYKPAPVETKPKFESKRLRKTKMGIGEGKCRKMRCKRAARQIGFKGHKG